MDRVHGVRRMGSTNFIKRGPLILGSATRIESGEGVRDLLITTAHQAMDDVGDSDEEGSAMGGNAPWGDD
jgi:hypothetical protein